MTGGRTLLSERVITSCVSRRPTFMDGPTSSPPLCAVTCPDGRAPSLPGCRRIPANPSGPGSGGWPGSRRCGTSSGRSAGGSRRRAHRSTGRELLIEATNQRDAAWPLEADALLVPCQVADDPADRVHLTDVPVGVLFADTPQGADPLGACEPQLL